MKRMDSKISEMKHGAYSSIYRSEGWGDLNSGFRKSGKFEINNQKYLLTYRDHWAKADVRKMLISILNPNPTVSYVEPVACFIAHENGSEDTYAHTHVLLDCGRNFRSKTPTVFDFVIPGITESYCHPHIKLVTTNTHWKRACNYLAKEDPENAHLKQDDRDMLTRYSELETMSQALSSINRLTDVSGCMNLYRFAQATKKRDELKEAALLKSHQFYGWQLELHLLLLLKGDDRHVKWIFDPIGNKGKSWFIRCMKELYPEDIYMCTSMGRRSDAATVIKGALEQGWSGNTLLLDLSRSDDGRDSIYGYIEDIRNGMMTATKYEGGSVSFQNKHLCIFANWLPRLEALSLDRWELFELQCLNNDIELSPLSIKEAERRVLQEHIPVGLDKLFGDK